MVTFFVWLKCVGMLISSNNFTLKLVLFYLCPTFPNTDYKCPSLIPVVTEWGDLEDYSPPPCMEVCRIPSAPLLAFYQVSRQFTAQYNFWVERDNVRVQCLVQEHPTLMSQRVKPRALGLEPNVQAALKPHGQYSFHSIFKEGHWHSVQKDLICNQFPSKTSPNLEDHMTVLMLKFLTFPLLSNRDCKIKIIWSESSVQSPVSHFHRWESLFFISYSKCILFWLVLKYPLTLFTMPLWL